MPWFKKSPEPEPNLPFSPQEYPIGTCVRTPTGTYRIGSDGKKYRIPTQRMLDSWDFPLVVVTTDVAVSKYPTAVTKLGFRDGTLLNNIADGKLYLAAGGKLRHVTSPEALRRLGLSKNDAVVVSAAEINMMKQGDALN